MRLWYDSSSDCYYINFTILMEPDEPVVSGSTSYALCYAICFAFMYSNICHGAEMYCSSPLTSACHDVTAPIAVAAAAAAASCQLHAQSK